MTNPRDYKIIAQERAEALAQASGREWDTLTGDEQSSLYTRALQEWCKGQMERWMARAEQERERLWKGWLT